MMTIVAWNGGVGGLAVRPSHRRDEQAITRDVTQPDLARTPGVVALEPLALTPGGGSLRLDRRRCSLGPDIELSIGHIRGPGPGPPAPVPDVAPPFPPLAP